MVPITALWMPIAVSAVLVFAASSLAHMVLPYHRGDYDKLPDEDGLLEALRAQKAGAGNYVAPHCVTPEERSSREVKAKLARGPLAFVTVIPSLAIGKQLVSWFVYCLVVGVFVAYLTGRTAAPGTDYLAVFRLAGTTAFLAYAGGTASESIWMGRKWSTTAKNVLDSLAYALLTAGAFGWLWPS
ncbi:MAG: hypothetical protein OES32_02895 [Acidobacteriota bacterium]|nr:hypothetical protein [Acidobacteriota bacterium]MDH3522510.1 hypothetical protein [Acidobacteriota bacterium]